MSLMHLPVWNPFPYLLGIFCVRSMVACIQVPDPFNLFAHTLFLVAIQLLGANHLHWNTSLILIRFCFDQNWLLFLVWDLCGWVLTIVFAYFWFRVSVLHSTLALSNAFAVFHTRLLICVYWVMLVLSQQCFVWTASFPFWFWNPLSSASTC